MTFHSMIAKFCPVLQRIDQMPPGGFCQAINICHEGCESLQVLSESGFHKNQKSKQKELTLCRFWASLSICSTCVNRLWSHPFCWPYQVGVPGVPVLVLVMHIWPQCCWNPGTSELSSQRSDSPSCKMSNAVIQVHGNKQGNLVVSSSPQNR